MPFSMLPAAFVYALRNVLARKASSAVTMLGVAVSVLVFVLMSATATGIARVAVTTGSPQNVMVLADGAASAEVSSLDLNAIQRARLVEGLARDRDGDAIASVEYVMSRTLRRSVGPGAPEESRFVTLRGVTRQAFEVHDGVRVARGRFPETPDEVLAGSLLVRKLGLRIGDEIWLDSQRAVVSGVLTAAGQVFAGEVWTDLRELRNRLGRNGASAIVMRVADGASVSSVVETLESTVGLGVSARAESEYYREIQRVAEPFSALARFIGLMLGLGAVLAGTNTLYAAMSRRTRELGTLRALGFGRWFVAGTLLLESVLVAAFGGLSGAVLALGFDGSALNLLGLSFELAVAPTTLAQGVVLALLIGVVGGALPARAALRLRIIEALRHA